MSTRIERAEAARGDHPLLDEELDEDVLAFIETVAPQLSNATNDPEEPLLLTANEPIELVYHLAEEPTSEPALDTPAVTDAAGVVPVVDLGGELAHPNPDLNGEKVAAQIVGRSADWLDLEATRHVYNLANTLSQSSLIPDALQGSATDTFVVLLTGHDLGITAMQALRGLSVIKGKPTMSADLLVALCRRSPDCEFFRLVETTATGATYETKRKGEPEPMRISWDIETAKRAGLWGSHTWSKYPRAMFRARTSAELARAMYPEVALGLYTFDEGEEIAAPRPPSRLKR
jgi:hypothetical protein